MVKKSVLLAVSLAICTTTWAPSLDFTVLASEPLGAYASSLEFKAPLPSYSTKGMHYLGDNERRAELYSVKSGDTLRSIGQLFGVSALDIAAYNLMINCNELIPDQLLKVPLTRKCVNVVEQVRLSEIAQKYNTTEDLLRYLNNLPLALTTLSEGALINVPERLNFVAPTDILRKQSSMSLIESDNQINRRSTVSESRNTKQNTKQNTKPKRSSSGQIRKTLPDERGSYDFIWPVRGKVTSKFGYRDGALHKGVDISHPQKSKALIQAAAAGVVVESKYHGAYGKTVVIDHGNGIKSRYAHMSKLSVSKGEVVSQGDVLGNMGMTGDATGYHVHFELSKNDTTIDPLTKL